LEAFRPGGDDLRGPQAMEEVGGMSTGGKIFQPGPSPQRGERLFSGKGRNQPGARPSQPGGGCRRGQCMGRCPCCPCALLPYENLTWKVG